VSTFVDTMLVRLARPEGLRQLLLPADDPARQRVRALFAEVYQLPFAAIHEVLDVTVTSSQCQRPVFGSRRTNGSWLQTLPGTSRGDLNFDSADGRNPHWMDLSADIQVSVVLQVDPGEVDSFRLTEIGEFTTLEEFRQKFRFFDLDAFMAQHRLSTVDDLRGAFHYLLGEVKLKPVPAFNAADPANQRQFGLTLAVLVRDTTDLAAALRDVRLLVAAAERSLTYRRELGEAEVRAPFAPLLVFPAAAGTELTQQQITEFFASQQILAVFETP
jgi:hypothetical protein